MTARTRGTRTETYADGSPAAMGDRVLVTATGESSFLRVLGINGYVTVYHHAWPVARVVHMSEITFVSRIED